VCNKNNNYLGFVLSVSVVLILILLVVLGYIYGQQLGYGLSTKQNDWSVFGSFFGGVFSPIVSFVTLIAILQTIKLQHTLLENQSKEFAKLHKLQVDAFNLQEAQLLHVKESAEQDRVSSYKQTLLTVVSQQIDVYQKAIDRERSGAEFLLGAKQRNERIEIEPQFSTNLNNKELYEKKVNDFNNLAIAIAIGEYDSIADLDQKFRTAYEAL